MALIVFVGVEGALIWSLIKFKARKGRVAAQIHGNTRLEIGWTVGAAVILVFITVVTFIKLPGIKNPRGVGHRRQRQPGRRRATLLRLDRPARAARRATTLNIIVDGQQYVWRYQYPARTTSRSSPTRRWSCPVGMTVTLDITADDVVHSWWIPKLGGKMDAVPGYMNKTWFKADAGRDVSAASAPSCAGATTRTCSPACGPCRSTSTRRWYDRQAADIKAARDAGAEQRAADPGRRAGRRRAAEAE